MFKTFNNRYVIGIYKADGPKAGATRIVSQVLLVAQTLPVIKPLVLDSCL